jgi:hypothetical protein
MQLSVFQQALEHQNYRSGIKVGSPRSPESSQAAYFIASVRQISGKKWTWDTDGSSQAKPCLSATPINAALAPPHIKAGRFSNNRS